MPYPLNALYAQLAQLRMSNNLSPEQVESKLVLGPGWVTGFETGSPEPSLGMLAALVSLYGSTLSEFFASIELGRDHAAPDRALFAAETEAGTSIHFQMGAEAAAVDLPGTTLAAVNRVLKTLSDGLVRTDKRREAVSEAFLTAVHEWPSVNPSDLWYFLIRHAYQDQYNHPAEAVGTDWAQSWARASGWALENVFARHYAGVLSGDGIKLAIASKAEASVYLERMGITGDKSAIEKADVFMLGKHPTTGDWVPFGVVHVKASFAERRTDDVPLSQKLMARNFASPLMTMDCKAAISPTPFNAGELGAPQGSDAEVSSKRLDIERDRNFDACFSYNTNTIATPIEQQAAARIYVSSFARDLEDPFVVYARSKFAQQFG